MDRNEVSGLWILAARKENESSTGIFSFVDASDGTIWKSFELVQSDQEVLCFDDGGGKCLQIGIRNRSKEERLEYDYDSIFESTSYFPGNYDLENKTIDLIDPGKFEILKDGRLHIVQTSGDYHCEEYWVRIPPEHIDLALFVISEIKYF